MPGLEDKKRFKDKTAGTGVSACAASADGFFTSEEGRFRKQWAEEEYNLWNDLNSLYTIQKNPGGSLGSCTTVYQDYAGSDRQFK